jgi:hypothetical protein
MSAHPTTASHSRCIDHEEEEQTMLEERRRILNMVAEGKISATDADGLLAAMASSKTPPPATELPAAPTSPKYLRVQVEEHDGDGSKVNIRVPLNLLRAGVRLAALLPAGLHGPINKALKDNGVDFDISKVKPEDLGELVEQLAELTVNVDGGKGEKVRVYCE